MVFSDLEVMLHRYGHAIAFDMGGEPYIIHEAEFTWIGVGSCWRVSVRQHHIIPALFFCPLLLSMAGTTFAAPVIWGTDEDTGHLVKIEKYDSTPLVTDYGRLSINDGGTIRPFPDTDTDNSDEFSDIESFTLNDRGFAFMIGNSTVEFGNGGTFSDPHLYSLRIFNTDGTEAVRVDDAEASNGYNAVESIGAISGFDESDDINGIDFDPIGGLIFGVVENGGRDDQRSTQ